MLPQIVQGNIPKAIQMAPLILPRRADVQQRRTAIARQVLNLIPMELPHFLALQILDHKTGNVYRILGGGIGRRIGKVKLRQFQSGHFCANGRCQYINALVHTVAANDLCTQQPQAFFFIQYLHCHRLCAGIIVDLYGERRLPELLRELCRLPFHWVRLHYLYPDNLSDELIDTIAGEAKICNYLDIPIQHCNDTVLKAMRRRETKAGLEELFRRVRERIPGVVLRTSLITGLPYEDEAAFEELCDFLGEQKLQRVGAFPYSPEEGTPAARMLNRVDTEEAQRRAELVMEIQTQVMDEFNDSRMGDTVEVLCDGYDVQAMSYVGRSYAESPGIDGCIFFTAERDVEPGDFVMVRITGAMDGDLTGEAVEELSEEE